MRHAGYQDTKEYLARELSRMTPLNYEEAQILLERCNWDFPGALEHVERCARAGLNWGCPTPDEVAAVAAAARVEPLKRIGIAYEKHETKAYEGSAVNRHERRKMRALARRR